MRKTASTVIYSREPQEYSKTISIINTDKWMLFELFEQKQSFLRLKTESTRFYYNIIEIIVRSAFETVADRIEIRNANKKNHLSWLAIDICEIGQFHQFI